MGVINLIEIIFLFIATIVIGFIFSDFLPSSSKELKIGFDWKRFWFSCLVAAPGIVLHELGHKFVAIAFGLSAHFELSYFGLGLGLILKLLGSGFILLAPNSCKTIPGAATKQANQNLFQSKPIFNSFELEGKKSEKIKPITIVAINKKIISIKVINTI